MIVNVWLGLRTTAQNAISTRLNWDEESQGEYTGPVSDRDAKVFRYMGDRGSKQRLFKKATISGGQYTLWSLDFDDNLARVKTEIDRLTADYTTQIRVVGAWDHADGAQIGTELTYDTRIVTKTWSVLNPDYDPNEFLEDGTTPNPAFDDRFVLRITGDVEEEYITGSTGTPTYPIPATQLLKFMPDVWNGTAYEAASILADVNLSAGQAPRSFV